MRVKSHKNYLTTNRAAQQQQSQHWGFRPFYAVANPNHVADVAPVGAKVIQLRLQQRLNTAKLHTRKVASAKAKPSKAAPKRKSRRK